MGDRPTRANYWSQRHEIAAAAGKPMFVSPEQLDEMREVLEPLSPPAPSLVPLGSVPIVLVEFDCASCGELDPYDECPKSERPCGHHCNHIWSHDHCDWCDIEVEGGNTDG